MPLGIDSREAAIEKVSKPTGLQRQQCVGARPRLRALLYLGPLVNRFGLRLDRFQRTDQPRHPLYYQFRSNLGFLALRLGRVQPAMPGPAAAATSPSSSSASYAAAARRVAPLLLALVMALALSPAHALLAPCPSSSSSLLLRRSVGLPPNSIGALASTGASPRETTYPPFPPHNHRPSKQQHSPRSRRPARLLHASAAPPAVEGKARSLLTGEVPFQLYNTASRKKEPFKTGACLGLVVYTPSVDEFIEWLN